MKLLNLTISKRGMANLIVGHIPVQYSTNYSQCFFLKLFYRTVISFEFIKSDTISDLEYSIYIYQYNTPALMEGMTVLQIITKNYRY